MVTQGRNGLLMEDASVEGLIVPAQKVPGSGWNQQQIQSQVSADLKVQVSSFLCGFNKQQRANGTKDLEDRNLSSAMGKVLC